MASDSESDYEREACETRSAALENIFSVHLLINRTEEFQRRDQMEILERLSLDNSLLQHLVVEYQKQWCRTIDLLEKVQEAVWSLQQAIEYYFSEHVAAEKAWLAFWGVERGSTAQHKHSLAGWI
jgi:hypothetical protein